MRRVLAVYEDARKHSLANYDEVKRVFIAATKLPEAVVDKQLKERTELTHSRIGAPQRESILAAGLALQQAGVVPASVDVKATVDALIDDRVPLPAGELTRRRWRPVARPSDPLVSRCRREQAACSGRSTLGEQRDHVHTHCIWRSAMSVVHMTVTAEHPVSTRARRRGSARSASRARRSASCCRSALPLLWELAVRAGLSDGRLVPPPSRIFDTLARARAHRRAAAPCDGDAAARRGGLRSRRRGRHAARRASPAIRRWRAAWSIRPCRRCARFPRSPGCRCSSCGSAFSRPRRSR